MRVIGLTGPARAGKDTIAQFIAEAYEGEVKRQGFADKLKLSAARVFDPHVDQDEALVFCNTIKQPGHEIIVDFPGGDHNAQSFSISGREFLQHYGTEAHREVFGEHFWLDAVLPPNRDDCDLLVIPDVRFENEAARVRNQGGEVWEVSRPDAEAVEAHASEAGIGGTYIDRFIKNDGSLEDLRENVLDSLGAAVPA